MNDSAAPVPTDWLKRWRKSRRESLLAARLAIDPRELESARHAIDRHLEGSFPALFAHGAVLGFCWPFRNEFDARFIAARVRAAGGVTALPRVVAPRMPLEFRVWQPGDALATGVYDIPYPAAGPAVIPTYLLVPMVGFDVEGYRLGYGGGYFDRTLAAMSPRPLAIGVALESAAIATIHPLPTDIPMDWIVTERGARPGTATRIFD